MFQNNSNNTNSVNEKSTGQGLVDAETRIKELEQVIE